MSRGVRADGGVEGGGKRGRAGQFVKRREKGASRAGPGGVRMTAEGLPMLGSAPGVARVKRRPDEPLCVLFVRVGEDEKRALEAWAQELRESGEVWRYLAVSDLVRDILRAALQARRVGV